DAPPRDDNPAHSQYAVYSPQRVALSTALRGARSRAVVRRAIQAAPPIDGHPRPADCASLSLANRHAEPVIGSIHCECLDHLIVVKRRSPTGSFVATPSTSWHAYLGWRNDEPVGRRVHSAGTITRLPLVGGLHHACVRIQ